jgi:hypothetical protein
MIMRETCNIATSSTMLLNTTSIGQRSSINKETMSARPSLEIVLMLEVARRGGRLAEARGMGSYRCPLPYPHLPPNTYGHHCRKQKIMLVKRMACNLHNHRDQGRSIVLSSLDTAQAFRYMNLALSNIAQFFVSKYGV